MEYLLAIAAGCGAPLVFAVVLPGAILFGLARRGRPLLDLWRDDACAGCGYDLSGLASDCCPECGRPYRRVMESETPVVVAEPTG